jgi:hypothetical protein
MSSQKVLCVSKDAGDWGNLAPVARVLLAEGVKVSFAVDEGSVSATKRLPGSDFEGETFGDVEGVRRRLRGKDPYVVLYGMSSVLGRGLEASLRHGGDSTWTAGLPALPDEYYHLWPTPPKAIFVNTDNEIKSVTKRWDGFCTGIKTGYPYLDPFPAAVSNLDREAIRKNLGVSPDDKLIWVGADKQGLEVFMEMALGAIVDLRRNNIVAFPNFHPAAADEERVAAEKVIAGCGLRLITDADLFGSYEGRFVAADIIVGTCLSTMPYQAHATGCRYIGTILPGDLQKQGDVIGSDRWEDNPFITGKNIFGSRDRENLSASLAVMLDGGMVSKPLPPLDGKATKRIVAEVMRHLN